MTYRFREHAEGLRLNVDYRNADEREHWTGRDPIKLFREVLIERGVGRRGRDGRAWRPRSPRRSRTA